MRVYHVGATTLLWPGVADYLDEISAGEYKVQFGKNPPHHDPQNLIELAGRLCYRSFEPGLNPNVEKVRSGNKEYLANILKQHHGSVLEHCVDSFIVTGVSRVLTHELVRHRHLSISQESLRYVRIEEIDLVEPGVELRYFKETAAKINALYQGVLAVLNWDGVAFGYKKALTSALRRLIPMGQKTSLMLTANARAWRWMIEARTAEGAEEEIRRLFVEIYRQLLTAYPNIYQDAFCGAKGVVEFGNSKV